MVPSEARYFIKLLEKNDSHRQNLNPEAVSKVFTKRSLILSWSHRNGVEQLKGADKLVLTYRIARRRNAETVAAGETAHDQFAGPSPERITGPSVGFLRNDPTAVIGDNDSVT